MATSTNALRTAARRELTARKKAARDHAKGKLLRGPSMRKLKIRA